MNESTQDVLVLVDGEAAVAGPVAVARAAATHGEAVVAVVAGTRAVADAVAASGVDRVLWLGEPGDGVPVEAQAAAVAEVVAGAAPRLVVAATRDAGRALAGAVAARCGAPVLTGATEVGIAGDAVEVRRDVHGGISVRTERVTGGPAVVTVAPGGVAAPASPVPVEEAVDTAPAAAVRVREERASGRAAVDLGGARVVVGIGRGLKAREDLAVVERLAAALGGEVACSRPLAEGHDWLTKDRYIGISGQHVAPDLYVAAGISGQVQHMVGVAGAKVVVAINSDADAPIFAQCDHGVVGDLYAVLPALAAALEA
jgi:electron transfer flavoprotein alpha subunit